MAQAQDLQLKLVEAHKTIYGEQSYEYLLAVSNLAQLYLDEGRYAESVTFGQEVLAKQLELLDPGNYSTLQSMNNLAFSYIKLERIEDAEKLFAKVVDNWEESEEPGALCLQNQLCAYTWQAWAVSRSVEAPPGSHPNSDENPWARTSRYTSSKIQLALTFEMQGMLDGA